MNQEVANRLQQLRKAKGLSQEELANILGLSRQAISKWERAETSPDTDNLICLARLYNISIDKLLDTSESTEEIKERIAQERIDEIKNSEKVDSNIFEEEKNLDDKQTEKKPLDDTFAEYFQDNREEIIIKRKPKKELSEEEKKKNEKKEKLTSRLLFSLLGLGIFTYVIIGSTYNDWSVGWEFIPISMFAWGLIYGFFEERQFSILSFFFILGLTAIAIRDLTNNSDVLDTAYIVIYFIVIITLVIYSIVALIMLLIYIFKNRKENEIIYYKNRINEINDRHFKELEKISKNSLIY
jgi:transcriptional regulator with XRE-family HTH domain